MERRSPFHGDRSQGTGLAPRQVVLARLHRLYALHDPPRASRPRGVVEEPSAHGAMETAPVRARQLQRRSGEMAQPEVSGTVRSTATRGAAAHVDHVGSLVRPPELMKAWRER